MNKIVRFKRYWQIVESKGGIFVTYEAIAIARAVIANDIEPDELFAAIALVLQDAQED